MGCLILFVIMIAAVVAVGIKGIMLAAVLAVACWVAYRWYGDWSRHRPPAPPRLPDPPAASRGDASAAAIRAAVPASQPIRATLLELTVELQAFEETIKRARQQRLPSDLIDRFQRRQREAQRLGQQSVERVGAVTRGFERVTPPPQLTETLARQQEKLARLILATRSARGALASVIVTGIGDQREVERATQSLGALSAAMCEAMAIGLADELAYCRVG